MFHHWLEIAYSGPDFRVLGVNRAQISIFSFYNPEKGTSLCDSASFEPLRPMPKVTVEH